MLAAVLDCTYCNDGRGALVLTLFQRCRQVTLQELNIDFFFFFKLINTMSYYNTLVTKKEKNK